MIGFSHSSGWHAGDVGGNVLNCDAENHEIWIIRWSVLMWHLLVFAR